MKMFVQIRQYFKNIQLQEEDQWKLCKKICMEIFEMTLSKFFWFCVVTNFTLVYIFQAFYFIYKFDLQLFIHYGPSYFISLYIMCCIWLLPFVINIIKLFLRNIDGVRVDCADIDVRNKNRKQLLLATIYIVTTAVLGLSVGIVFSLPTEEDKNFYFCMDLIETFCPEFEDVILFGFRCVMVPISYITVICPGCQLVYMILQVKSQLNNFHFCLRNINKGVENIEGLDGQSKDVVIKKRLLFFIKTNTEACRLSRNLLRNVETIVYPLQIVAILSMSSIVVLFYTVMDERSSKYWYWRGPLITISALFVFGGIMFSGQQLEDINDEIFDTLVEIEWYDWNETNKKLYLMLLINSVKPFKIRFSENISVNYQMGLQFIRDFFSAMSIVGGLQNK